MKATLIGAKAASALRNPAEQRRASIQAGFRVAKMKGIVCIFVLICACSAKAKLIFFGGINDPNIQPFPDPLMWGSRSIGIYNAVNATYSDSQYVIQTGPDSFNWAYFDQLTKLCAQYGLKRMWYGMYEAVATQPWLNANGNLGGLNGEQLVQAFTNYVAAAAQRAPQIDYINYCNEGLLSDGSGTMEQAFGGPGATGIDWIINIGKLFRQYFPNSKIGINELGFESAGNDLAYEKYGSYSSRLSLVLPKLKILKDAGILDFVGEEGYSLECCSSANITSALDQVGALGVGIIMTEFSPDAYLGDAVDPKKVKADWQRLFPLYYNNSYVWGILGPWGYRARWSWVPGSQFFIDDRQTPSRIEPVVSYLQGIVPQVVGGAPGASATPTPTWNASPASTPSPHGRLRPGPQW